MLLIICKRRIKGKEKCIKSRERNIRMCVSLYALNVNSNHGIALKARMSSFLRPPLFLCNPKVNLNYFVRVKEK